MRDDRTYINKPYMQQSRHDDGRMTREEVLIDALRMAANKNVQAILLETYIQEYGAISDENGEIVRQILVERSEERREE